MGTSAVQDDPMLRLRYYRETGQSDEATKYEQYLRETGQFAGGSDIHSEYRSGRLAKRMARENANDADMANAETPSYGEQALGGLASLARDIPGAEALQAGARSLVRGQPYRTALQDIRGAEADAPKAVRVGNNISVGTLAMTAIPGSAALSGARYGVAKGLLQADPVDLKTRLHDAAKEGAAGAVFGKAGELIGTGARALFTSSLGVNALKRKAAMEAADHLAYGRAAAEGAANGGTSPAIQHALSAPDIAPYADAVRSSRTFANADDATVLREAYKLMSERQGLLSTRMVNASDFKAGTSLEARDVAAAKQDLLRASEAPYTQHTPAVMGEAPPIQTAQSPAPSLRDALSNFDLRKGLAALRPQGTVAQQSARQALERHAAESIVSPPLTGAPPGPRMVELSPAVDTPMPAVMPSLRGAIEQHAQMAGEKDAFRMGADAAKRILNGTQVAGKKLEKNSAEAFLESIKKMSPSEANAAREGLLGRLRETPRLNANPLKLFGGTAAYSQMSKLAPFLRALDQQTGRTAAPNVLPVAGLSLFD